MKAEIFRRNLSFFCITSRLPVELQMTVCQYLILENNLQIIEKVIKFQHLRNYKNSKPVVGLENNFLDFKRRSVNSEMAQKEMRKIIKMFA